MLGRRRMMRQAMRGGAGQQKVHEAQRLMAEGKFAAAAAEFDQLGQQAVQHGMIRPAIYLALQASRAYAQAKRGNEALAQARRALDLILNAGQPARATRAIPHAAAVLRANGFTTQAVALEKETAQRLALFGLSVQDLPQSSTHSLPPTCPQCAGPLRSNEADWIDAATAECPWCGSAVKAV
ncbi:MAG TPA: hypothetical protein VMP08_07530 [Anaerolineae bacterium]|nr:hypothetical protein [Anaerolineae bacterium]